MDEKRFKVGVFARLRKDRCGWLYDAYTRWYSPTWKNDDGSAACCEHEVTAASGTEAKRLAIQECRDQHEAARR